MKLAYIVKKSLVEKVDVIVYITDSTIALCWCHNTNKRLWSFVLSRVESAKRMI